jgi:hypothetical protein
MRLTGSSFPAGFQASDGEIGSIATAAARSTVWMSGCSLPGASFFSRRWA